MIVKDRWVVHRVTSNDNEWQRMTTSCATNDNEWQRMTSSSTTNDNEWYNEWKPALQQKITSDKANEYGWEKVKLSDFMIQKNRNNFIEFSIQYITTIRTSRSQMFFGIGVYKVYNIHRKTPVLESLFSKVESLEACAAPFVEQFLS